MSILLVCTIPLSFILLAFFFSSNSCNLVLALAGLVVSDSEWFSGSDVPRQPDRDPLYGEQLWGVTDHGEGIHEGRDEDQGG